MTKLTQFAKNRMRGIGGTDAAAILRKHPYTCPLEVYRDKTGESKPKESNIDMRFGTHCEAFLLKEYQDLYGYKVFKPGTIRNKDYPFLFANVDGIVNGDHIVEFKTSKAFDRWAPEPEGLASPNDVPMEYYIQIQHYLMVTGMKKATIYACIGRNHPEYKLYTFERNNDFITKMRIKLIGFWHNNVLKGIPPKAMTREEVAMLFPEPEPKKTVEATDEVIQAVNAFVELKEANKKAAKREKEAVDFLISFCQDAEYIVSNGVELLSFKADKRGRRSLKLKI